MQIYIYFSTANILYRNTDEDRSRNTRLRLASPFFREKSTIPICRLPVFFNSSEINQKCISMVRQHYIQMI